MLCDINILGSHQSAELSYIGRCNVRHRVELPQPFSLQVDTDADFAGDKNDRKSYSDNTVMLGQRVSTPYAGTAGYCPLYGRGRISSPLSRSEAASMATVQLALRELRIDHDCDNGNVATLYGVNEGSVSLIKNPIK